MSTHTAILWIVYRATLYGTQIIGLYPTHTEAESAAQKAAVAQALVWAGTGTGATE